MMWNIDTGRSLLDDVTALGVPLLVDSAIKAALLVVAVALTAMALRKASSAVRHLVWLLALAALPSLPIALYSAPGWHVLPSWATLSWRSQQSEMQSASDSRKTSDAAITTVNLSASFADESTGASQPIGPSRAGALEFLASGPTQTTSPLSLVMIAWAIGVLIVLLPWLAGRVSLWRLEQGSFRMTEGRLAALSERLRSQLGIRRSVRLLLSQHRDMPMQWGFIRPRVLLPLQARTWPDDRVSAVLLHELAHARRHDCLTQFAARLVVSLYWFHPLVWWAQRRLHVESELACDDLTVTRSDHDATDYAEHLLFVAANTRVALPLRPGAICMTRRSRLEERLRAILDRERDRRGVSLGGILGCLGIVTTMSLPLAVLRAEQPVANEPAEVVPHDGILDGDTKAQTDEDSAPIRLGYVDNSAEGKRSIAGSGHAVKFHRPDDAKLLMSVEIFASRYGHPQPPEEDFHLYVLDQNQELIQAIPYPYAMIERGSQRWYTLKLPAITVPTQFHIAFAFNPHSTKGVYLGFDKSVSQTHSLVGRPTSGYGPVKERYDWMVRAVLVRERSRDNPFENTE